MCFSRVIPSAYNSPESPESGSAYLRLPRPRAVRRKGNLNERFMKLPTPSFKIKKKKGEREQNGGAVPRGSNLAWGASSRLLLRRRWKKIPRRNPCNDRPDRAGARPATADAVCCTCVACTICNVHPRGMRKSPGGVYWIKTVDDCLQLAVVAPEASSYPAIQNVKSHKDILTATATTYICRQRACNIVAPLRGSREAVGH